MTVAGDVEEVQSIYTFWARDTDRERDGNGLKFSVPLLNGWGVVVVG